METRLPSWTAQAARDRVAAALGWAAAGLLVLSLFLPFWKVRLFAPQYRQGLSAVMGASTLTGDIEEIDGLNHYVGVAKLGSLARVERLIAVPGILFLAALAALAFRRGRTRASLPMSAAVVSFPLVFMADLKYWMHRASTDLDPMAPLKLKPFSIPLFGTGKVGQFRSEVWPSWGFACAVLAALLVLAALWLTRRREPQAADSGAGKPAPAHGALALLLLAAAGAAQAQTLQQRVDAAAPGSVLEVEAGAHAGPLRVDKPLTLRGAPGAVVDGRGSGTVVVVSSPGVTLDGLTIRGSGESLMFEDSGVRVSAASATIRRCVIEDVLFGVFLDGAPGAAVEDSVIRGKPLEMGRRGDLLRAWNADRALIRNNRVEQGRDMVLWFSTGSVVEGNTVTGGRYGLHFMYTNGARVTGNRFADSSVGLYIMYSRGVLVEGNRFERHRGPSGAGLGLKESGVLVVRGNLFSENRQGVYIDQSPLTPEDANLFERNRIAHNDVGVAILPGAKDNTFTENDFVDNLQQVSRRGGGGLGGNAWSREGRGNFWSDYAGYAPAGAATGLVPYRLDGVLESLLERNDASRWFLFTPALRALELASRAFPLFRPKPVLVDEHPVLASVAPVFSAETAGAGPGAAASGALLLLAALTALGASRGRHGAGPAPAAAPVPAPAVSARGVGKSFAGRRILEGASFELEPGGALVLWGANGAGKSTLIKCLLGLLRHEGRIELFGRDAAGDGAAARRRVGYVPQQAPGGEWTAREALEFVCAVRGEDPAGAPAALERVGLAAEGGKRVAALSGGMRQRLALAQALVGEPELLVLDEPCANLDLAGRRDFLRLLRELKGTRAILMSSHRLEEVEMLADRVLWLEEGRAPRLLDAMDFLAEADGRRPLWLQLEREHEAARAVARLGDAGFPASPNGRGVWAEVPPGRTMEAVRRLEEAGIAVRDLRRGGWS